jgi:hypothetical protein
MRGAAAAWPFAAIAPQDQRIKLVGVFPSVGIDQSSVEDRMLSYTPFSEFVGKDRFICHRGVL